MKEISERIGKSLFEKRRAIEIEREEEYHNPFGVHFTYIKQHVIKPIVRTVFKMLGLYERGLRNFLDFRLERFEVPISGLPMQFDGFRLLHVSDLHVDLEPPFAPAAAKFLSKIECDACAITGDFRNLTVGPWEAAVDGSVEIVKAIRAPVYAVLGNHDTLDMVEPIESAGAHFLLNESVTIERNGATLAICGIDDPNIYETDDLDRAKNGAPQNSFRVLLSHSPCIFKRAEKAGFKLLLAGHTHGGQVCLPGGRPIKNNDPTPRRFQHGLWRFGELVGHTSAGLGSCGIPVRINCPPTATLLVLKSK